MKTLIGFIIVFFLGMLLWIFLLCGCKKQPTIKKETDPHTANWQHWPIERTTRDTI